LFGFIVSQPFAVPGFVVGAELLIFAILNSLLVRHEQKTAALENQ
jgi:ABC-type sulfate transport system permease component